MQNIFNNKYKNINTLVTGHTGFKGSWLCFWLNKLGANVTGYSLEPPTNPNHISILSFNMNSMIGDIRNKNKLEKCFKETKPEIVFHLAAQPFVRDSYFNPTNTYESNVIGTLNVLEACRRHSSVKAVVIITTDKVYKNKEWEWAYREIDQLGGYDPYSSSKACAELLVSSYRDSFFNLKDLGSKHNVLIVTCRAGNVMGGGDWGKNRLVPDIVKATTVGSVVKIRNPHHVRPWQHVLETLSGYLHLGSKLLNRESSFSGCWNFGCSSESYTSVEQVVIALKKHWNSIEYSIESDVHRLRETTILRIDSSKSNLLLDWSPVLSQEQTFEYVANWYKKFYLNKEVNTENDLESYLNLAKKQNKSWIS